MPLDLSACPSHWQIPCFSATTLRGQHSPCCVCVFVLNEGERIRTQLERMIPLTDLVDVVVADGGSSDGALTLDFLDDVGARGLLVKKGPGQLSAQMRMALGWALQQGYEGMVVMDGNNKDDPQAIPTFVERLRAGFDHVQGSRYLPGGKAINTPWSRHLAVRWLHAPLISLASGFPYTDTTNGFRAYSRRFLLDERVAPFREVFQAYELHYYLAIRAARLGFRVCEVPVTRAYPPSGQTPTKIRGLRGNFQVLKTLLRACRHRFNPSTRAA
jgi:dolichol-phosphate mannosyltransferase